MTYLKLFLANIIFMYIFPTFASALPIEPTSDDQDTSSVNAIQTMLNINSNFTYLGKVGSKQFYVLREKLEWQRATRFCGGLGMKLAQVENITELEFFDEKLGNETEGSYPYNYWTGGMHNHQLAHFSWATQSPSGTITYERPLVNAPRGWGISYDQYLCIVLKGQSKLTFFFQVEQCKVPERVLCQITTASI